MKNNLHLGDCLDLLSELPPNSVDLIYVDPPFFSAKKHRLSNRERTQKFVFSDLWKSNETYAEYLFDRLNATKRVLKETGSIFVHCDKNAQHIVRVILDKIYGEENFQSEIIWRYKRWSNAKKGLLPAHQNIYFYSKSAGFQFNQLYTPYSDTTNIDQILQKRTRDKYNKSVYKKSETGETIQGAEKQGVPLSDVWDIAFLNPTAKERVGYPTQKPLRLIEQIIQLTTHEDDIVLDPFCGSGTACVAAKSLKRKYIGFDISEQAVSLAQTRLDELDQEPAKTRNRYHKAKPNIEEELNMLKGIIFYPVLRNNGIDAILKDYYKDKPVFIRVQKPSETLENGISKLHKAMLKKGSCKSFFIQTEVDSEYMMSEVPDGIQILKSPSLKIQETIFRQ